MTDHNYPPDPFNEWRESVLDAHAEDKLRNQKVFYVRGCHIEIGKFFPTPGKIQFVPNDECRLPYFFI